MSNAVDMTFFRTAFSAIICFINSKGDTGDNIVTVNVNTSKCSKYL